MSYADLRQAANRELVKILSELVESHPDLRFGQLLMTQGFLESYTTGNQFDSDTHIQDPFNEEPMTTLKRVEEKVTRP